MGVTIPIPAIQIVFGLSTITAALLGVCIQERSLRYASLGAVPDISGAFLGGSPECAYEKGKKYYTDVRAYHRYGSTVLGTVANRILFLSVVSGTLLNFILTATIGFILFAALLFIIVLTLSITMPNIRRSLRDQESNLEIARATYNDQVEKEAKGAPASWKTPAIPFERVKTIW